MKLKVIAGALLLCVAQVGAEDGMPWAASYADAQRDALVSGKLIMVDLKAEW